MHISTGDLLRAEVKKDSSDGKIAKEYMAKGAVWCHCCLKWVRCAGQLVPNEVVAPILKRRLNESDCLTRGWLLDGYPREQVRWPLSMLTLIVCWSARRSTATSSLPTI